MPNLDKEPASITPDVINPPRQYGSFGEAAMASIGSDYSTYPLADEQGVRVPIPHHPEIVAYRMSGGARNDRTVDDLIKLDQMIKAQEEASDS